ncbi:MAG TPA: hypothetical protein VM008_05135 [Phycisphaerae bacterium]|nr:hypothetical protein [Phycisphaerae bacterium]
MAMNGLNEELIEAAAAEALGANTPKDSAAYPQQVAAGGEDAQRLDRQLRETVALLAAASPFMKPSEDLRGRILQTTAPTTFRMEDYRKSMKDSGRFYRWGFYAAMAFLAAGAWFNMITQNQLTTMQGQMQALGNQVKARDVAITDLISPKADQVAIMQDNKLSGKAFVNDETHTAVVVLPQGILPPNKTIDKMTMTRNGKKVTYGVVALTTSREAFPQWSGAQLNPNFSVDHVTPDPQQKVYTATMAH